MRVLLIYIFIACAGLCIGQDKIYLLDGSCKTATILEIGESAIIAVTQEGNQNIDKSDVLLIDFKSSGPWILNPSQKDVIYDPAKEVKRVLPAKKREFLPSGYASLNTMALCNADIAGFYERLLPKRLIGIGAMAAYNFNPQATGPNGYLAIFHNAKKKYDVGVYANLYTAEIDEEEETVLYFGLMLKYLKFDFSKVTEVAAQPGGAAQLTYSPASGSQLATLLVAGTHSTLHNNFFIKSIFGLGGFNMRGDYREQYNYMMNKNNGQTNSNRKFLLKLYLGINIGMRF